MSHDTMQNALNVKFERACTKGDLQEVQRALASGQLSADQLDTGLQLATLHAHPHIVAALFDAGVPMTPGAVGSLCGKDGGQQDPRVIRLFFDRGLNPRKCTTSRGEPLLRFFGSDCAREFLERGVDPNRCGPRKVSPLVSALGKVRKDGGAVFDLLVEYGATVDAGLFFNALVWGTDSAIKTRFLLSRGLDPNATTSAEMGHAFTCGGPLRARAGHQDSAGCGRGSDGSIGMREFRGSKPHGACRFAVTEMFGEFWHEKHMSADTQAPYRCTRRSSSFSDGTGDPQAAHYRHQKVADF
ncbi:hypothetical protein BO99DRAFT_441957 [Aspergillus violaceofuscus CBS 115571]|uniref:Ankyrin repeat protein n=1 Tax=Aspergillus violaceofuscus (strain CBS 115571) TaxID=1450538 RepID=A0A2V5HG82_ASPV1|nr:hypothetical protein BO99DRAFT_441957 [Aspergillus violaceofuscus CBS 115571]